MARQQSDREDLLREATALVERAEIKIAGHSEPVVAGFRRDGSASVFFGADTVCQFNSENQLRRGFLDGRLIKAESGKLVSLRREQCESQVQMIRHDFDEEETSQYLALVNTQLSNLRKSLEGGDFKLIGQVPADVDVVARIRSWLDSLGSDIVIATSPHAR